jgi:hypothetical protein
MDAEIGRKCWDFRDRVATHSCDIALDASVTKLGGPVTA